MRIRIISVVTIFLITYGLSAQVGIGTVSPSAELEISGSNTGIPTLELNPQSAPTGSTTGQLAVIGDMLFMYDATRGKWLSVESTTLALGRGGNINSGNLRATGNQANSRSGYLMPFNGTIVAITAKSNDGNGAQTKQFSVRVRNGNTTNTSMNITTSSSEYINTAANVDFSSGDYINVTSNNDGNGNVSNASVVIWVKWRR
ncbi:MAG: hypothetical protein JKY22_01355 [Flavobacteriaceae bacterium]|nr:hypothetical protein [Flavobacteriaceae bacterium]